MIPSLPERPSPPVERVQDGRATFSPPQVVQRALESFQRGDWAEAERLCRLILKDQSDNPGALHVLGIIAAQTGRTNEALELLSRAVGANPGDSAAHNSRANVLRDLRRFLEALESYNRAIALKPDYFQAHNSRGNTLRDLGRHGEALTSHERAIALNPAFAEAHFSRGITFVMLGRSDDALQSFERAITLKPSYAEAHFFRGTVLTKLRRLSQAAESYEHAIRLKPDFAEAHAQRGNVLMDLGMYAQAIVCYERAIAIAPNVAEYFGYRGNALRALKQPADALRSYERAIALKPGYAEGHNGLGNLLRELGRQEQALEQYDYAIAHEPGHVEAHNNRGVMLLDLDRPMQALDSFERAITIRPDFSAGHCNRGVALMGLDRAAEALESYDRAIALGPDQAEVHSNRGIALSELGRFGEAKQSYERAVALDPEHASAQFNLATCRLLTGDLSAGWEGLEWRWKLKRHAGLKRGFVQPQWRGECGLDGKMVLLHAEQGLGDTLQFCRYAERVAAGGAKVVLEVQPPLVPLLAGLQGIAQVVAAGDPLPAFDYHCPLMSLPLAFGTVAGDIPARVPYIRSNPALVTEWRKRLGEATGPRVGLVWSGNAARYNDRKRSLTLARLQSILHHGVEWVSLQKELREADAGVLQSSGVIRHFGSELHDFADTAALVDLMDLVVTVDTSVAHLAGAMGKAAWILLSFNADWRWHLDRDDSPWYPTVRLFRQPAAGDWDSVIGQVDRELTRRFAERC